MANQLVGSIAMAAALITLVTGLWQDWGTYATLKRLVLSYLAFFFLGSVLVLVVRLAGQGPGADNRKADARASGAD
jgi:hypothetical protein